MSSKSANAKKERKWEGKRRKHSKKEKTRSGTQTHLRSTMSSFTEDRLRDKLDRLSPTMQSIQSLFHPS